MKIKILSDSTCDFSPALAETYNVTIVPLLVMKGEAEFSDGVDIHPQDIFDHVAAGGALCSTAARSVGVYQEVFAGFAQEYDALLHFSIGANFSSSYQNATLAASTFENVYTFDTSSLSAGQGLIVLKACQLAETAENMDDLLAQLERYREKIDGSFVVDKLTYLAKGGRCSSATALGANLLNLKPCIELKDGLLVVGKKYRGNLGKTVQNYVADRLAKAETIDRETVILVTAAIADEIRQQTLESLQNFGFRNILEMTAGCTISCHCGPGTLGIMFAEK